MKKTAAFAFLHLKGRKILQLRCGTLIIFTLVGIMTKFGDNTLAFFKPLRGSWGYAPTDEAANKAETVTRGMKWKILGRF